MSYLTANHSMSYTVNNIIFGIKRHPRASKKERNMTLGFIIIQKIEDMPYFQQILPYCIYIEFL